MSAANKTSAKAAAKNTKPISSFFAKAKDTTASESPTKRAKRQSGAVAVGQVVEVEFNGAWSQATIFAEVAAGVKVQFSDGSFSVVAEDETITRIRPSGARASSITEVVTTATATPPASPAKARAGSPRKAAAKASASLAAAAEKEEEGEGDDDDAPEEDEADVEEEEEGDFEMTPSRAGGGKAKVSAGTGKKAGKKAAKSVESAKKRKAAEAPAATAEEVAAAGSSLHPKKSGAFSVPEGTVPDIGSVVKAKVKDKWYTALVVKHERWGITQAYAVRALTVVFDRDIPKPKATYDMGSDDLLLTGEVRTVRYWSSGTPCMRSTGVDTHAVRTDEAAAAAAQAKTKKVSAVGAGKAPKYNGPQNVRAALGRADALAAKVLAGLGEGQAPTTAQATAVFEAIGSDWPTQDRPNVTPNGKPVTGFCLGAVYVLGGVGMATSHVSLAFPSLCRCLTAWVAASLPDAGFPFSSLQINYNYRAKRHVDGNNIGPSYITALGDHSGGGLWTADQYVSTTDPKDGSLVVKGGGGEAVLDCRNCWKLFNGNAEHETQPMGPLEGKSSFTRVSVIVFSNSNYNRLPPFTVEEMVDLGFTAASSSGEDHPFFKRYRIDKKEFSANQNKTYIGYLMQRATQYPPPPAPGRCCIECFGLTMNRGGGWMSFAGTAGEKGAGKGPTIVELEPNRTGLHVLELKSDRGGLSLVSSHVNNHRFNVYKDEVKEVARFAKWVAGLPSGRVVLITITDTAIAAKRPPGRDLYAALEQLGADLKMERIGYRLPFAFIGIKGGGPSTALQAMDKTKILLRLEASVSASASASGAEGGGTGSVSLEASTIERTDITELMLSED